MRQFTVSPSPAGKHVNKHVLTIWLHPYVSFMTQTQLIFPIPPVSALRYTQPLQSNLRRRDKFNFVFSQHSPTTKGYFGQRKIRSQKLIKVMSPRLALKIGPRFCFCGQISQIYGIFKGSFYILCEGFCESGEGDAHKDAAFECACDCDDSACVCG